MIDCRLWWVNWVDWLIEGGCACRVMFDTIVCRGWAPGEFLLQVDRQLASMVVKHLSLYKGRESILGLWMDYSSQNRKNYIKNIFLFLINTCYYLLQSRLQLIWEIGSNTCYLLSWWQWGGRLWSKLRLTSTCPPSLVTVSPINKRPHTRPGLASYCHEPLT